MLKKLLFILLFCFISISFWTTLDYFEVDPIYSEEIEDAVNSNWIDDPLRNGTTNIWENTQGIAMNWEITNSEEAKEQTTNLISKVVNYFLALAWLVALIYLLYHWFLILTAAWDDAKYKKWMKWIQIAMIALAWIWFSRFIVSLILSVISNSV